MAEMVKRWRGGTAGDKGLSQVGAKIELAKKQKEQPTLEWKIAPHPDLPERFELQAFTK